MLDGTWDKKQVWRPPVSKLRPEAKVRPMFKSEVGSKRTLLNKVSPTVIWHLGNCAPLVSPLTKKGQRCNDITWTLVDIWVLLARSVDLS